jgi:hypothetical protein
MSPSKREGPGLPKRHVSRIIRTGSEESLLVPNTSKYLCKIHVHDRYIPILKYPTLAGKIEILL